MTATVSPPLLAWLDAQIAWDEQSATAMRDATWPDEVLVAAVDDTGKTRPDGIVARVTIGPQYSPKAYARVWHPGESDRLDYTGSPHGVEVAVWSPNVAARALAECAAKRRILDRHTRNIARGIIRGSSQYECSHCLQELWPCPDVLDVAVVYQDRDGWHEGWAPDG